MIDPASIKELSDELRSQRTSTADREEVSLSRLNKVVRHTPHDMTATVECGITLADLQSRLAESNQWLPLDPPGAGSLSIREILDNDLSGPRRFGFGTARDWVIGMKAVLPDGRIAETGGNVVKNVAGYDLHRLMIGARGELGVVAEATFKVTPIPEAEVFVVAEFGDLDSAFEVIDAIWDSAVDPHVLDLYALTENVMALVVGFHGSKLEVDWQLKHLPSSADWRNTNLDYDLRRSNWSHDRCLQSESVAPSKLKSKLNERFGQPFVARVGNGTVYFSASSDQSGHRTFLDNRCFELFTAPSESPLEMEERKL